MVDRRDSHSRSPAAESLTILVVEDEALTCFDISEFLKSCGFHVIEAVNAIEALIELQSGEPIAVVFTDIRMPGAMDGLGLAEWVWRERPDVKVILTSGAPQASIAARESCEEAAFIAKPYVPRDVERHIRDLLTH